jgi:hypothetical protein
MPNNKTRQADDASFARLMDFAHDDDPLWSQQELGAIWRHQLQTSLISSPEVEANESLTASLARHAQSVPPIRTFGELLSHAQPPVELLEFVKQYAKSCRIGTDAAIPDEIATVLYIVSIVAAMTKCDRAISKMDAIAQRHCVDWALEQTWLDEPTRRLLESGSDAVGVDG